MKTTSILVANSHALIRQSWAALLATHPPIKVVAEASTLEETIEACRRQLPDIVILDFDMPGVDALDTIGLIGQTSPDSNLVGVFSHTQPLYARKMLQSGLMGYITKYSSLRELFAAIREVLSGSKYICDEIKNALARQMIFGDAVQTAVSALTFREKEIIRLLKAGLLSAQIAEQLSLSSKTVEVHRYNILKKLNLKNTAALVNFAHLHQVC